jgi:DNA recombination protein RmuC
MLSIEWISIAAVTFAALTGFIFSVIAYNKSRAENKWLLAKAEDDKVLYQQQIKEINQHLVNEQTQHQQTRLNLQQLASDKASLTTRLQAEQEKHQQQIELLENNKQQMLKDFELLANRVFEEKQQKFSESSQQNLSSLLNPFKQQISDFKQRVDSIHTEDTKAQAALANELKNLQQLNHKVSEEANNLVKALKGDNKQQGNWGELQAEMILEASGLKKGEQFFREANYKDSDGNNKRPDIIVALPGGKSVIVDSKVSMISYVAAVEAEQESVRNVKLSQHVASIKQHITDLSSKDYINLEGMDSPDFVLMFMPIEPAFLAAVEHDRSLFNYGFERNVIMVTPTTLLPIVRTVANLWVLERSNEQAREIVDQAADIYNQLSVMAERFQKVGAGLKTVSNAYNSTLTAITGQQGLYPKIEKFKALSVKVSKTLPEIRSDIPDLDLHKLDAIHSENLKLDSEKTSLED